MKKKLRILILASGFWLLTSFSAFAQFTQVTGTITDPNGVPYTGIGGGSIAATLIVPGNQSPTLNGASIAGVMSPVGLDSNGHFAIQLADNNVILPAGTQWQFQVQESPGEAPPWGYGPVTFSVTLTITGSSQNIGATLSAAAPPLTRATSSGGFVTSVNGTANQINSTGGNTPTLSIANPLIIPGQTTITAPTGNVAALTLTGSNNVGNPDIFHFNLAGGGNAFKSDYVGNGSLAGSLTTGGGTGVGLIKSTEGTCSGATAGFDVLCADSSGNGFKISNNGGPFVAIGTGGTVTSVTFTGDGTVLSSTPSTAVTTSGTLNATLNTVPQNTVLAGSNGGGTVAPTFRALVSADLPAGQASIGTQALYLSYSNSATVGTTAGHLVFLTTGGVRNILTTTVDDILGVCTTGIVTGDACGATGTADIAVIGRVACVFDGATTALDFVVASTTTAGDCHDAGTTIPTTSANLGTVISTNGGAGTYDIFFATPDISLQGNSAGGGGGKGTSVQINGTTSKANINFNSTTPAAGAGALNLPFAQSVSGNTTSSSVSVPANGITSSQLAVVNTDRSAAIDLGADNASSALVDADIGPQLNKFQIPYAATIFEIDVISDAGTPNVIVQKNHLGTPSDLLSSALAASSSGTCSNVSGTTGVNGSTTCSATLQNTSIAAGDWIGLTSGTAGGTAKTLNIVVHFRVN